MVRARGPTWLLPPVLWVTAGQGEGGAWPRACEAARVRPARTLGCKPHNGAALDVAQAPVAGDALRSTIDLSQGGLAAILRGGATGGMPTSGTASPDSVWRGDTAWRS